jgi:hypothetical protein
MSRFCPNKGGYTVKSRFPKLFDKKVYEYYYDFCYVYERICDLVNDTIDPKTKVFESDESYKFVNCLGRYVALRAKSGSKVDKAMIQHNDYYKLIPEAIWENLCDEVEAWCSGIDNPYEDMMSDCFLEVLDSNKFNNTLEGRKICAKCENKIKCEMATTSS